MPQNSTQAAQRGPVRFGRWQDVLADVECDALICDPPYSAQTHECAETKKRNDGARAVGLAPNYEAFTDDDVRDLVAAWAPRCRGWMVCLTDSNLTSTFRAAYEAVGRYAFAPVPCVINGMSVRLSGDGPSSWTVYAMVSRPSCRDFATWGTLPGAYVGNRKTGAGTGRGKPDWLMRAIVRDYTRKGDLVVDPFTGWGSTLSAALGLGRRAIGAECDADAFAETQRRLARGQQTDLFAAG